jgi:hypothetical protein
VRGSRSRPERADIDPADIPRLVLPHVVMLDVVAENDFRYRLIGTGITKALGRDLTGKSVTSTWYGESYRQLSDAYGQVATTGLPAQVTGEGRWQDHHWKFEAIVLPLGPTDGVNILLCGCEFERNGRTVDAEVSAEILSLETIPLSLDAPDLLVA